jgi:hypothetical protein
MSSDNNINLPSVDAAVGILDSVYSDVFFSKMAEYGLVPQTQEGALSMLETAAYLDSIPDNTKQASEDPFVSANIRLKQALASEGVINPNVFAEQNDVAIKQAAFALAHEPELYKAMLAVRTAGGN